jgi:hypothetical protein
VITILKTVKDPKIPSSYKPISPWHRIDNLFENILFARILHEVSECGMMRDEQLGYFPKHITSLKLACLVQRTRNFGEKRLTDPGFLDMAKAFHTVWFDDFLYKLTLLNFPSYVDNKISSYLWGWTFEASFHTATVSRLGKRAGLA